MNVVRRMSLVMLASLALSACVGEAQEDRTADIFWDDPRDECDPSYDGPVFSWWGDYPITCLPKDESAFDITDVVGTFQRESPQWAKDRIAGASREQLLGDVSVSFVQNVTDVAGAAPRHAAVEITSGLVEVPYDRFVQILPVENWGVELSSRLGGDVLLYDVDDRGRATRQLERMVLSPFSIPLWTGLGDNDMTKVELIDYDEDGARVMWRVIYSDNNATEMDVGSVEFRRFDASSTRITFHSAHRLNALGAVHVASNILAPVLEPTFRAFIDHYRKLVDASAP